MNKKAFMIIICLLISAILLTGCVESLKQGAIAGDYSNKEVTSNGGLAVTYGKYLYFVNGAADKDAENAFGDVVKGAIMRVELDKDKTPILSTLTTIVPKKVYSTDATYGGIYIYNDYIYYPTTGMTRDSQGNPKTDEMVIMRTRIDGTDTETVIEFDNHSVPYKIVNSSLVYIKDNDIYRINLLDKKFASKVVEEGIDSSYHFTTTSKNNNSMDNYVIYTITDQDTSRKTVKAMSIDGDVKKDIFKSEMIGDDAVYTPTIIDIRYNGTDKLTIFYNITDDKPNTPFAGIYSYTYDSGFAFDKANLVKYTNNPSSTAGFEYTKFYFVEDKVLALGTTKNNTDTTVSKLDLYSATGDYLFNADVFNASIKVFDIYKEDGGYYMYYTSNNKLFNIKLLNENNGALTKADSDSVLYYDGAFGTQGVSAEIINNVLYFFNSNISSNIYYLDLSKVEARNADSRKASVLGIITDQDRMAAF